MRLRNLLTECGSAKALKHHYYNVYEPIFENYRDKEFNLLQFGVYKGADIEAWTRFFPKAKIFCMDDYDEISPDDVPILGHNRVHFLFGSGTRRVPKDWENIKFDIIIDDAVHTPDYNLETFENYWSSCTGHYFIEDVWPIHTMKELNHPWLQQFPDDYTHEKQEQLLRALPNHTEHDFRPMTSFPDSFLIHIERE